MQDVVKSIDAKEEADEFTIGQLEYIETAIAEIRKRSPQPQSTRGRKRDDQKEEQEANG
jgi:hypothetical protein